MPNTAKRNPFKATVLAAAIAVLPLVTHAAGLGKITVLSALGQPLKAELEVSASRDEASSLVARLAAVEAFRQAGIDYSPALATLRFSRDIKERGGRRYLEITTDRPLNEPFIDMLVELSWASGRLVREYTFLLDPPDLAAKTAPAPIAAPEVGTAPAARPVDRPAAAVPAETRPVMESRPPAPMRPAEKPAAKPAVASSREVVPGDTLGKIAAQTLPEGVSLDQMLVALFRNNSDAFIAGNMNRLKAGKILSIPDAETASQVSAGEARREVVAQAADFNTYRRRLAAAAAASEPAGDQGAKQAVSGRISPKVEDKMPLAAGKDKLEVSRTEAARGAGDKPLQGRIAALEEDLVSRDRALKEASGRIAELEKNLSDLKKLAEIKSQAGADLQKAAQASQPAAAPKAAEPPKPVEIAKPAEAPKSAEPVQAADAAAKPAEAAKPAAAPKPPPPKKKAVPPPPPEPEPDFIEENAPLVFGGGAVLALLFAWLGITAYRKKRGAKISNAPIAETDLSAHSVFSTTSVAPPPSEQETSQFSTTGMGMAANQETVDPVVEADTFLAFGRDAQAEEILLEALKTDPQRQAIHLKLLDIYAARKNAGQFELVARDMHALTGGTGEVWDKVAAMGAALDPGCSLYASGSSGDQAAAPIPAAGPDMNATMIIQPGVITAEAQPAAAAEPTAPAAPVALDFDLDIGTSDTTSAVTPAAEIKTESAGLDFDLDLGAPAAASAPAPAAQAEVRSEEVILDINFDMPTKEAPAEAPAPASGLDFPVAAETPAPVAAPAAPVAAATDSGSIDFDFDLGTPETAAPAPLPEMSIDVPTPAPTPAEFNLGDISLELDTPAGTAPEPVAAAAVADMPDNPEVATKLELAAAYEEMGDKDGARELFQEALAEGSPAQQKAARAKLDSLA
ncbi:MAG: FimV/HubP family polar landmark protein [Pseudomonadota bacterium]